MIEESIREMNNSVLSGWILDGIQSIIHGTTHGRMRTKEPFGNEHHPSANEAASCGKNRTESCKLKTEL